MIGIDIHTAFDRLAERAAEQLGLAALPPNLSFFTIERGGAPAQPESLDGFFSWSTFEHIDRAELPAVAASLAASLKHSAFGFVQIEPLYYSAYGSHLGQFVREPWAHLLLSHDEFAERVREATGELDPSSRDERYRRRGPEAHRERMVAEFESLNGLTADELVKVFSKAGLRVNKEHRAELDLEPPAALLDGHRREDLVTNEVRMLIERPSPSVLSRLRRRRG